MELEASILLVLYLLDNSRSTSMNYLYDSVSFTAWSLGLEVIIYDSKIYYKGKTGSYHCSLIVMNSIK